MTIYNYYTIRELAPQQHECIPDMNFGYNAGRIKNRIYLPDTFVGATYYFDGEYSNRYGTSQLDDEAHPYIDINFNDGETGNGTVFIIAGKRYCTFPYTLEYVNVHETEIDASEIDTSNLVTKQTFDNTVERIDNDILTGDTANRTAIDQLTAATNQKFADVNTKLSGYDEEIGAVNAEIKNLASEVDGYSTDIAQAVADAADAKSIAESAADDAATASAEAGEAKDAVSNLGIRVTQVETDVETAETVANQAKSTAGAAAQTASTAQSIASAAQTAAGQAQTSADDAKTAADNAQSTADEAKQAAQTNAGEITTIKEQVTAIQQKDTEQDEKIGTLEDTTATTAETVNTLQENYNTLNDSVGLLTSQVDNLDTQFDALQTTYVKSRQTWTGNVTPEGQPYSIPATVLSLLINIVGSSYSAGETITFEFYANTTDESPAMQIPCRVLSTDISNLDVVIDFAAGTFSIYETDISQTPAKQLTKKLANGFNVMRTYTNGYKKINVKTSATHETPNTMFMIVRSLY